LKSVIVGTEGRHYPDTDTLEIDQPRIRIMGAEGKVTTASAVRGLINADGSEAQLFEKAVVVREAAVNAQGVSTPRSELQSDFLHFFANTEQVKSHLPVVMIRGSGDRFTGDGMGFDNLARTVEINGRVRGVLQPRKQRDKQ
jgi:lipopolysaccharide export system protein LptC